MDEFGPAYPKINSLWKRDQAKRNVVIPGEWATPEFAYLAELDWSWTEKVDGTNIRLHWNGQAVTVGGRTDNAQVPASLVAALRPVLDPPQWANTFGDDPATVYGEGYGAKIQSGGQYRPDQTVIVFDILVDRWWLRREDVATVASQLRLETVPYVCDATLEDAWRRMASPNLRSAWPEARIEGLVGRPLVELFDRKGERILAKVKVKDYRDWERNQ